MRHPNLVPSYGGLLESKRSKLKLLKSTFSAENIICRLSWSIFSDVGGRNSLLRCVSQSKNAKTSSKSLIFSVQGRSRSSTLVLPESSSTVFIMISSKSLSICNRFHAGRVENNDILGVPFFDALVRGESPHPAARNLH